MMPAHPRILYVDDNKEICRMIEVVLGFIDDSYEILTVSQPVETLPFIKDHSIDLYILDYSMPEISGIELCRKIRETDSKTPVIFFSALGGDSYQKAGIQAGADSYLTKPNDIELLAETVKRLLNDDLTKKGQ